MRAVLIVNPQATSTTAGGRDVLAHALASQVKLDVVHTGHRGHAADLARAAAEEGIDLIVAHGGDGTVNEAVNGLLAGPVRAEAPALGVVPGGSVNVFARALGLPRDPVEATHVLLTAIEQNRTRRVGLGRAGHRWFTFNAGLGWDADAVAAVERRRGKRTSSSLYARAAVASYLRPPLGRAHLTVHLPGVAPEAVSTAFVSNTDPWSYLGVRPIHLNPEASFDAGLGLFALRRLGTITVLRHLRHALREGKHPHHKLISANDLPRVRIEAADPANLQVDGDLVGQVREVEFVSVPRALAITM